MPKHGLVRRFSMPVALGLLSACLSACQPIGSGDPLEQDAFATEAAPLMPADDFR